MAIKDHTLHDGPGDGGARTNLADLTFRAGQWLAQKIAKTGHWFLDHALPTMANWFGQVYKYLRKKTPIVLSYLKVKTISFGAFSWCMAWRFMGFRRRTASEVAGFYAYLQKPHTDRRGVMAPWEAVAVGCIAIWASSSVEISLTAWEDLLTPPWGVIWRIWFAIPFVWLVANRQNAQMKAAKEKRIKLRQEEVRLHRKRMYLPDDM